MAQTSAPWQEAQPKDQVVGGCPSCGHLIFKGDRIIGTGTAVPPSFHCRGCDGTYIEDQLITNAEILTVAKPILEAFQPRVDLEAIKAATHMILTAIGEDPDREGLADTPRRVANFWREFVEYSDDNMNTTFESFQADQMVVVSGIPTWSLCEHHLLPFSATISVGYIPDPPDKNGQILGLSKVARVVHHCAHRLQTQERLVDDVSKKIEELLGRCMGVAVVASGVHTCMTMRGVRTPGVMTTSKVSGVFKRQQEVRDEFFSLIRHSLDYGRW